MNDHVNATGEDGEVNDCDSTHVRRRGMVGHINTWVRMAKKKNTVNTKEGRWVSYPC